MNSKPVIIDFPQAVPREEENALEYLERDVKNILIYFERKLGINTEFDEVMNYITVK